MKWLLAVAVTVLLAAPAMADDLPSPYEILSRPTVVQPYQPVTMPNLGPAFDPYIPPVPTETRCVEMTPGVVDCSSW